MAFEIYDISWNDGIPQTGQIVLKSTVDTILKAQKWCDDEGFENCEVTGKASTIANAKGGGVIVPTSSGGMPI